MLGQSQSLFLGAEINLSRFLQILWSENLCPPIQTALNLVRLILSPEINLNLSSIVIVFSRLVSDTSR